MRSGNIYQHYKGGLYEFISIAMPYENGRYNGELNTIFKVYDAHSDSNFEADEVKLYAPHNLIGHITDRPNAHVIYRSLKDTGKWILWAREVEEFFGHLEDGRKRFTLIQDS